MAHYAFLNERNIVVEVIVGRDETDSTDGITDWEQFYGNLRGLPCKRTSYNSYGGVNLRTAEVGFRKNFAGIGFTYDPVKDAFIPPSPYPSWVLNEDLCIWEAPIPMPEDDLHYHWNERIREWEPIGEQPV